MYHLGKQIEVLLSSVHVGLQVGRHVYGSVKGHQKQRAVGKFAGTFLY